MRILTAQHQILDDARRLNHRQVQRGLHVHPKGETIFASYQETKIRHFHQTLNKWLESDTAPKSS